MHVAWSTSPLPDVRLQYGIPRAASPGALVCVCVRVRVVIRCVVTGFAWQMFGLALILQDQLSACLLRACGCVLLRLLRLPARMVAACPVLQLVLATNLLDLRGTLRSLCTHVEQNACDCASIEGCALHLRNRVRYGVCRSISIMRVLLISNGI